MGIHLTVLHMSPARCIYVLPLHSPSRQYFFLIWSACVQLSQLLRHGGEIAAVCCSYTARKGFTATSASAGARVSPRHSSHVNCTLHTSPCRRSRKLSNMAGTGHLSICLTASIRHYAKCKFMPGASLWQVQVVLGDSLSSLLKSVQH